MFGSMGNYSHKNFTRGNKLFTQMNFIPEVEKKKGGGWSTSSHCKAHRFKSAAC